MRYICFLLLFTYGCSPHSVTKEEKGGFYKAFLASKLNNVKADLVVNNYLESIETVDFSYLSSLSGTRVNLLCEFYGQVRRSEMTIDPEHKARIENDRLVVSRFLTETPNAGNIYRDCAKEFDLKIDDGLRLNN